MARKLEKLLPKSLRQALLSAARKPLSAYLRGVEAGIPKTSLSSKHLQHAELLPDRLELLRRLPSNAIVAELGVDVGGYSEKILEICTPAKLHLVDFWGSKRYNQQKKEAVFNKFDSLIKQGRVEINLGLSTQVVNSFPDNYFDWIYIDTNHTYRTTAEELAKYLPKMKAGGIIAGHDYTVGNWIEMRRYGVIEAVHEFCVREGWEILYLTMDGKVPHSFAIRKI